jgi:hypothetical protein
MWLSQVFGGATMCGISVISSAIPFQDARNEYYRPHRIKRVRSFLAVSDQTFCYGSFRAEVLSTGQIF